MIAPPRVRTALLAVGLLATIVFGHGASKGLHLHVTPDPAPRGGRVEVEIDASSTLRSLKIGFVGQPALVLDIDPPSREARAELRVPESAAGDAANVQAEALTSEGGTLRASAVVRIGDAERRE